MENNFVKLPDIDIDFADRNKALMLIEHIPASSKDGTQKHPSGVYLQDIPVHPISGLSAFDYRTAESLGYFKIDFLNYSLYEQVKSDEHLRMLVNTTPDWSLLQHAEIVAKLNHIRDHFDIVKMINPQSVEDLAIVLALIRPGKSWLKHKPIEEIRANIWNIDESQYTFKKSHATAYAVSIVVQMNLLSE